MTDPKTTDAREAVEESVGATQATPEASPRRRIRVKWALDQARRDLVDPSRRNRLLHAPLVGKFYTMLARGADFLFAALA